MAKAIIDEQNLTDIADAIRAKNGSADTYLPSEMATAIGDLPTPTPVTKGLVFSDYDADGYPTKAEFVGMTEVPSAYFNNINRNNTYTTDAFKFVTINIPSTIKTIKDHAFHYTCLPIVLNEGLETIETMAFEDNRKQTSWEIPSSVTSLGQRVFNTNTVLTTVTFKGSVPNLLNGVFKYSTAITLYDFSNHTGAIPTLYDTASLGHASGCVIKVPQSLLSTWQTTAVWQDLTGVVWQGV